MQIWGIWEKTSTMGTQRIEPQAEKTELQAGFCTLRHIQQQQQQHQKENELYKKRMRPIF